MLTFNEHYIKMDRNKPKQWIPMAKLIWLQRSAGGAVKVINCGKVKCIVQLLVGGVVGGVVVGVVVGEFHCEFP